MTTELSANNRVVSNAANAVCVTFKVLVPDCLCHILDDLYGKSQLAVKQMLMHREKNSSKYYPEIPCVIAKSLISKYQKNKKCKVVSNLVLPVCGDKGKQVKVIDGGIRVPAIFKKQIIPVTFPKPIVGFIRQVEFFKRDGRWYMSYSYNTPKDEPRKISGVVGVDRNSVGNIAVLADLQTGKVLKLGIDPANTKKVMRNRRSNLQRDGKFKLLRKIGNKQYRRITYENHRVSKAIVDYATKHRRAIVLEDLTSVRKKSSKARRYAELAQWSYYQLETFLKYKAALRGIPIYYVNPAYTSRACSKCGTINTPNGKLFSCNGCGHHDHRDTNASFVIAKRFYDGSFGLSVPDEGSIGSPQAGKDGSRVTKS